MGTDISKFKRVYSTRVEGDFPEEYKLRLTKESDLKYGENPNQHAAIYTDASEVARLTNIQYVRTDDKGKGGLSLTNMMDISRAMDVLKYFSQPAAVIMKHCIVSGFAKGNKPLGELFRRARDADVRSNFGGSLVTNKSLDLQTAEAMYEKQGFFIDNVAAPEFEQGVVGFIESKSKTIRIAKYAHLDMLPKFVGDDTRGLLSIKELPSGRVALQTPYLTSIRSIADVVLDPMVGEHEIKRRPAENESDDLLTAWYLNLAGARSNGIVMVRDGVTVAVGSGQVERVGAVEQAIVKGMQKAMDREGVEYDSLMGMAGYEQLSVNPFKGASCSSDAFFPMRDSIDRLARVGVSAVIQPFGSIKDEEVIKAANEHNMAMVATGERCFGHF